MLNLSDGLAGVQQRRDQIVGEDIRLDLTEDVVRGEVSKDTACNTPFRTP